MQERGCADVVECIRTHPELKEMLRSTADDLGQIESENICRIHVHARSFDWAQPPNRNKGGSGTGTGFVLDIFPPTDTHIFVVTAHHVVSHSVQIRVNFAKLSSEYVPAVVVGSNPDMDVALLAIDVNALQGVAVPSGLLYGDADSITPPATVFAHGFALGKAHMQTTKGVVSGRIEGPSRLQTDVAVNPGNSGGPLLDHGNRVIGIVTSGMMDAQGINYVAPINEAAIILRRCLSQWSELVEKRPVGDKLPSLNCSFAKGNRILLSQVQGCSSGVICTAVHPLVEFPQTPADALSNLRQNRESYRGNQKVLKRLEDQLDVPELAFPDGLVMGRQNWHVFVSHTCTRDPATASELVSLLRFRALQEGDLVCAIVVNGRRYDIDLQMTSKYDFWHDNIGFGAILDRLSCDGSDRSPVDTVVLELFRDNRIERIPVSLRPQLNTFRRVHADNEPVSYVVAAGVFVMPLLHNHIPLFRREPLYTLMNRPQSRHESILIVTHILPESPFNECETVGAGDVIVALNNTPTLTLQQFRDAWERGTAMGDERVLTLRMRDGSLASATNAQITDADARIRAEYGPDGYVGYCATQP